MAPKSSDQEQRLELQADQAQLHRPAQRSTNRSARNCLFRGDSVPGWHRRAPKKHNASDPHWSSTPPRWGPERACLHRESSGPRLRGDEVPHATSRTTCPSRRAETLSTSRSAIGRSLKHGIAALLNGDGASTAPPLRGLNTCRHWVLVKGRWNRSPIRRAPRQVPARSSGGLAVDARAIDGYRCPQEAQLPVPEKNPRRHSARRRRSLRVRGCAGSEAGVQTGGWNRRAQSYTCSRFDLPL